MLKAGAAIDKELMKHPKLLSGKPDESCDDLYEDVTVDQGSNKLGQASSLRSLRADIKKKFKYPLNVCVDDLSSLRSSRAAIKKNKLKYQKKKKMYYRLDECVDYFSSLISSGAAIKKKLSREERRNKLRKRLKKELSDKLRRPRELESRYGPYGGRII